MMEAAPSHDPNDTILSKVYDLVYQYWVGQVGQAAVDERLKDSLPVRAIVLYEMVDLDGDSIIGHCVVGHATYSAVLGLMAVAEESVLAEMRGDMRPT